LLLDFFTRLAPWPVHWIDPAAAIARRADHVISDRFPKGAFSEGRPGFSFQYTSGAAPAENLVAALADLRGAKENLRAGV
jgi:glutamate racemase